MLSCFRFLINDHSLTVSNQPVQLLIYRVQEKILSHEAFPYLLRDAEVFVYGHFEDGLHAYNSVMNTARIKVETAEEPSAENIAELVYNSDLMGSNSRKRKSKKARWMLSTHLTVSPLNGLMDRWD